MAAVNKLFSNFRCFLCGNVEDDEKQKPMYIVTKSRFSKWKQVIRKKGLKVGSKLFGVHFDTEDVVRGRIASVKFRNYKTHRLAVGVLPKHYLGNLLLFWFPSFLLFNFYILRNFARYSFYVTQL